jgi:hypothetical protein
MGRLKKLIFFCGNSLQTLFFECNIHHDLHMHLDPSPLTIAIAIEPYKA